MDQKDEQVLDIWINLRFSTQKHIDKETVLKNLSMWISSQIREKSDPQELLSSIQEREALGTTGFGDGFAIPHGKVENLKKPALIVVRLEEATQWDALDDQKVDHLFIILVPKEDTDNRHLSLLSTLAYHLMDEKIKKQVKTIQEEKEMRRLIETIFEKGR